MAYKHDYDKTLTRLVSILSKLYSGDNLSVKDLAEEFNVSTRTIQRDFNNRLISFPIYQENKLWKMQDGFRLEKSNSIEDSIILNIMEKLVESVGDEFSSKAKKLLSKIKNKEFNPIYTKLNMEDIGDKLKEIQELESSIKLKKEINCNYEAKDNKNLNLQLKPLKIVNFEGFWYLIALDVNDKDLLKKYYLRNISTIKLLKNKFLIDNRVERILEKVTTI
jgi:predicted DNA-binding transcriptional regulator YafY